MRTIYILIAADGSIESAIPNNMAGFVGEHNATILDITIPTSMTADYYRLHFSTSGGVVNTENLTATANHITYSMPQDLTLVYGKVPMTVTGVTVDGEDVVGLVKSATYNLNILPSTGEPVGVIPSTLVDPLEAAIGAASGAATAANAAAAEVENIRNSAVKNTVFASADARVEAMENDAYFPLTNIVENGDFEDTTGWTPAAATHSVADNILSITGNGGYIAGYDYYLSNTAINVTSQYYFKLLARVTNAVCANISFLVQGSTVAGSKSIETIALPTQDAWYSMSAIITPNTTSTGYLKLQINHEYATSAIENGKVLEVKYVVAIDLTARFGAGNEPTIDEMDAIMSYFPDSWFNGTVNVAAQEWLAKYLMRSNIGETLLSLVVGIGNHISEGVAHRGYSSTAPENTLPSYTLAKTNGFKYVECDVQWTADGIPVLLHDLTIDRTSDGTGNVLDLTLDQLKLYDFGSWKSAAYNGTAIPTFEEFIVLCKSLSLHPYIEIKSAIIPTRAETLVNLVKKYGMINDVTWISFDSSSLVYISDVVPKARLGYIVSTLSEGEITSAIALKNLVNDVFIDSDYTSITAALLASALSQGISVEVWTIDDNANALNMIKLGVNGISTNALNMETVCAMKETTLAYWKMNEISGGTCADLSGNGHTGTISGTVGIVDGLVSDSGKARQGNGTDGVIKTTFNMSGLSNFKITGYFRKDSAGTAGYQDIFNGYRNSAGTGIGIYFIYHTNGSFFCNVITSTGSTGQFYIAHAPVIGTVYKFVFEYTGLVATITIYSLSGGVLTLIGTNSVARTGSLNASILDANILASNNIVPVEYAPFTVDEIKVTSIL